MQDQNQFQQLIMMYNQLKNGAEDIKTLIEKENYDDALTMIKAREPIYLNCKCVRKFLELTPVQETELNLLLDELKTIELYNIQLLEAGMAQVRQELKKTHQSKKLHNAYNSDANAVGNIANFEE